MKYAAAINQLKVARQRVEREGERREADYQSEIACINRELADRTDRINALRTDNSKQEVDCR